MRSRTLPERGVEALTGHVLRAQRTCATPEKALWWAGLRPADSGKAAGYLHQKASLLPVQKLKTFASAAKSIRWGPPSSSMLEWKPVSSRFLFFAQGVHTPTGTSCSTR